MTKDDYRNTEFCPALDNVAEKKKQLEEQIVCESPQTKIFYNKVRARKERYHQLFAEIYCKKCAYCGAKWGLLPVECFEIDHFIHEASYPKTQAGKVEAGKLNNLIWSCHVCNRKKRGIKIETPYDAILNPDDGSIATVFYREKDFYIKITKEYQNDEFVNRFYNALSLGYELRRLDFMLLKLEGMYQNEKDALRKQMLGESLSIMMKKRNSIIP